MNYRTISKTKTISLLALFLILMVTNRADAQIMSKNPVTTGLNNIVLKVFEPALPESFANMQRTAFQNKLDRGMAVYTGSDIFSKVMIQIVPVSDGPLAINEEKIKEKVGQVNTVKKGALTLYFQGAAAKDASLSNSGAVWVFQGDWGVMVGGKILENASLSPKQVRENLEVLMTQYDLSVLKGLKFPEEKSILGNVKIGEEKEYVLDKVLSYRTDEARWAGFGKDDEDIRVLFYDLTDITETGTYILGTKAEAKEENVIAAGFMDMFGDYFDKVSGEFRVKSLENGMLKATFKFTAYEKDTHFPSKKTVKGELNAPFAHESLAEGKIRL